MKTAIAAVGLAVLGLVALPSSAWSAAPSPVRTAAVPGFRHACAPASGHRATCFAQYRTVGSAATIEGYGPTDIASAYGLSTTAGAGKRVAIVDAFDDPKAEADLAVYRSHFGLPACTTANGCFRKVNQNGAAAPLPKGNVDWAIETSLDLDAVSASCPQCKILLVEGNSDSVDDLGLAAATAGGMGVAAVSNSYGTTEFNGSRAYKKYYRHDGVAYLASSGDYGFPEPDIPAGFDATIAVGGTTLEAATNDRKWTETAWSSAGSGCSAYFAKPAWQKDKNCPMRTVADVSAVADPDTGLAIYDTYGVPGWGEGGGTSLSAPLVAGMVAIAGRPIETAKPLYAHPNAFHDVVGGSNGYCGGDYLCTAVKGYDAPTGLGTPAGVGGL